MDVLDKIEKKFYAFFAEGTDFPKYSLMYVVVCMFAWK
jgi:hypothetical protein